MLEKHRQQLIKEILEKELFACVRSLTEKLNSSESTIRRDITKMAKRGEIKKIRGGAESLTNEKNSQVNSYNVSKNNDINAIEINQVIVKKAAKLCSDGDSIIINGDNIAATIGNYLSELNLDILTNSFIVAASLSENTNHHVSIPGGQLYREQGIILSLDEQSSTEYYHSSMMFIGASAISKFGLMGSDPLMITAAQKLKKQAEKLVVLADSANLDKAGRFIICPLNAIDILITDSRADDELLNTFTRQGIEVIIADKQ